MTHGYLDGRVEILQGDLTRLEVDAVVNAANATLLGGGGVDGAIHRAAGPGLLEETRTLGGCPTGEAKITRGHGLPARWIIHAVGPRWRGGDHDEDDLLANAYLRSLELARDVQARSVAFPAISTGAYGFPLERATRIAQEEVRAFLEENQLPEKVVFCCFSDRDLAAYLRLADDVLR